MSENQPNPPDNSAISAMRTHIANLEKDLSDVKVSRSMTEQEKATLESQKQVLERDLEQAKAELQEKEQLKTRAAELESTLSNLVAKKLQEFPEDKREEAKLIVEGLTVDKQLEKLAALSGFLGGNFTPPSANPPAPPLTPTVNNQNNQQTPPPADTDPLAKFKEIAAKGGDPLAALTLKKS